MTHSGHRHRLILYWVVLNRFWRKIFGIGIVLLSLAAVVAWLPSILPQYNPPPLTPRMLWLTGGVGAITVVFAIILVIASRSAYVQPLDKALQLATPFLRMKIPYQLFIQASAAQMGRLFPLENLKGQKRALLRPFSQQTVIVLELRNWPLPRRVIELFLYHYFFPDETARLMLMVPDWIKFSTELESFRSIWLDSIQHPPPTPHSTLLASLLEKR